LPVGNRSLATWWIKLSGRHATRRVCGLTQGSSDAKRYQWAKERLMAERVVTNIHKPKLLFTKIEWTRFNTAFWTSDNTHFMHPRNRAQIPFALAVFLLDWSTDWCNTSKIAERCRRGNLIQGKGSMQWLLWLLAHEGVGYRSCAATNL
jgi:hypothetical protein